MPDNNKRKPILWEKPGNNLVKCSICHNYCVIPRDAISRCFSRKNANGEMELNNYGFISSIAVDPIEKKPLYHFHPGTKVLSVGGWGCNFKCKHCQNWQISQISATNIEQNGGRYLSPEKLVDLISETGSQGISWTYNEPAIWLEYTLDSAKLAKERGFYTAYVSNGYITKEALDELAPYLDAFRVDLKSSEDKFYREICGVSSAKGVFETTKYAKELGMHIETVTNIIPTYNDSRENLRNIARWIAENLGTKTPWHVTRFFPNYELSNIAPTPLETINMAVEIGQQEGLEFIYKGNIPEKADTICPNCKNIAVSRDKYITLNTDKSGNCKYCGENLNLTLNNP